VNFDKWKTARMGDICLSKPYEAHYLEGGLHLIEIPTDGLLEELLTKKHIGAEKWRNQDLLPLKYR